MLLDIGYKGRSWTFEKRVVGGTYTRCRLDRALANKPWMARFATASLEHLMAAMLDHSPLLLDLGRGKRNLHEHTFRYEAMWEKHEELKGFVQAEWAVHGTCNNIQDLHDKLQRVSAGLTKWSKQSFGSVRKEIKDLKKRLDEVRGDPLRVAPTHVELKTNEGLIELYHRKEIMWR